MPDNQVESLITNFPGINGIANVLGEKLIPLNVLRLKIFNSIRLQDLGPHIMTSLEAFISATVLCLSISVLSLLFYLDTTYRGLNIYCYIAFES